MEMLRENGGRESSESSNPIAGNNIEILRICENAEQLENMSYMFPSDWRKGAGERSRKVAHFI